MIQESIAPLKVAVPTGLAGVAVKSDSKKEFSASCGVLQVTDRLEIAGGEPELAFQVHRPPHDCLDRVHTDPSSREKWVGGVFAIDVCAAAEKPAVNPHLRERGDTCVRPRRVDV